jgi:hypothetical protein
MSPEVSARAERVVRIVLNAIVDDGIEELSVREIAERIGCSPVQASYAAYKVFEIDHGWLRIVPTDTYVDVHERNFGTVTHQRKCQGYMVQRTYLAQLLKEYRHGKSI